MILFGEGGMMCPTEGESDNQLQTSLAFHQGTRVDQNGLPQPALLPSFPSAKKSSYRLRPRMVMSVIQGFLSQFRGVLPIIQQLLVPTPYMQRCLVPYHRLLALPKKGPRAQPHKDRKPFAFSKNIGPKVGQPQLLLLCQSNLGERK